MGTAWSNATLFLYFWIVLEGNWLAKGDRKLRSKLVIATKVFAPMDPSDVNARGLSRHHIMSAVDASLQRLKTSYIDLYQVQCYRLTI